ncbi:MAG: hypothetical protein SPC24_07220 [Alphaproteobacteria bacterium]|nr:hypothetical protein [Alphaproteobacteria bacterium]
MDSPPWYFRQGVPAKNDAESGGGKARKRAACYIASVLVISESIIFFAKPYKNVLNGRKSAFNQMFRICRERERDLCLAYFSSFFPHF